MFELDESESYSWPVKHKRAISGGKYQTQTFDVEFKRISVEESKAKLTAANYTDFDFASEILVGWSGIKEKGEDVPFSDEAKKKLLNRQGVATAIVQAFFESIKGASEKN